MHQDACSYHSPNTLDQIKKHCVTGHSLTSKLVFIPILIYFQLYLKVILLKKVQTMNYL